jgi:hypothetical protein
MLTDPQSITVNAVAQSLPRISAGTNTATYQKDDGTYRLTISHSYNTNRNRRVARIDQTKITSDPFIPANNTQVKLGVYIVVDEPISGFTVTERKYIVDALTAWLTASSDANTIALLGGQS